METIEINTNAGSDQEDYADEEQVEPKRQHKAWIYGHFGPPTNSKLKCKYCE